MSNTCSSLNLPTLLCVTRILYLPSPCRSSLFNMSRRHRGPRLGEERSDSDSNNEDEYRALPQGVVRQGGKSSGAGVWAGEEMERELLRSQRSEKGLLKDQFQNNEVGKGYQHKTVIRQKGVGDGTGSTVLLDMTKQKEDKVDGSSRNKDGGRKRSRGDQLLDEDRAKTMEELKKAFMDNANLRKFKTEITRILKGA
jgi:hypothetical protein